MIVAFDFGSKNIGVATTDEREIFSFARCSIPTAEYVTNPKILMDMIPQLKEAHTLVVGHPKNLKNVSTLSTISAETFGEELISLFPNKEVIFFDERFTSSIALKQSKSTKIKTKKKTRQERAQKDQIEAQIILQDYLKRRENEK